MARNNPLVSDPAGLGQTLDAVLVIAGSDSSGGAGLQRDLRVLAHYDVQARVAVTAVTAQSNDEVFAVHPIPAPIIADQIMAAAKCGALQAVKIGMLGTRDAVEVVAHGLASLPRIPVVLDPVLASSSGAELLPEDARQALIHSLCALVTVITPNLHEAARLLGQPPARNAEEIRRQAIELSELCRCAVLLKGGHRSDEQAIDLLVDQQTTTAITGTWIETTMRGTGCALSTAMAVHLSRGHSLVEACQRSKALVEKFMALRRTS